MAKKNQEEQGTSVETSTENALDVSFRKFVKWFGILFAVIVGGYLTFPFFNVPVGEIGIVENFFTKSLETKNVGLHVINPFSTKHSYDLGYQVLDFNGQAKTEASKQFYDAPLVKRDYSQLPLATAITKDGHNLNISMAVTFRLKESEVVKIYEKSKDAYVETIVLPGVSKALGDVFGKKDFYSVIMGKDSISEELKTSISNVFENDGFEIVSFSFRQVEYSPELATRVENIFDAQKEVKLAELKKERISTELATQKLESDSKLELLSKMKTNGISADDYMKVTLSKTFGEKWDGSLVPEALSKILNGK